MKEFIVTDYGVKPDSKEFQTKEIQRVIDLCKAEGGKVIIPKGEYYISSLRLWSYTTLYLQSGALLIGSEEVDDYIVYDFPEGIESRNDWDFFHSGEKHLPEYNKYRRAIISAYGEKNIAVIGEEGSVIDGRDCFDAEGEEGFRGPHGFYLTNCSNVTLEGYTIQNSGNFMHQTDNCKNITFKNITGLGGHDGTHMHFCENVLIENCKFITGDDCIAGANMRNVIVRSCELNTSCQIFRVGGKDILIENCHLYGPGYYPHRMTIVKGKNNYLPREEGRHNALCAIIYFAGEAFPDTVPHSITVRNCRIENIDSLFLYDSDFVDIPGVCCNYQKGGYLRELNIENIKVSGLKRGSKLNGNEKNPLTVNIKNFEYSFSDDAETNELFDGEPQNTVIID